MAAGESNGSSFQDDCMPKFAEETFWTYAHAVIVAIIGTIGLLGNIFIIAVLCRPKMRKSVFYNLLLALACFDTLFILSHTSGLAYIGLAFQPNCLVVILLDTINRPCFVGSIYMTVAISWERYLGICHPHSRFSRRSSLVFILPVVLISFAFTFTIFLERKFSFANGKLVIDQLPAYFDIYNAYIVWGSLIFLTILPLVALLFLNVSIIAAVRRSRNLQRTQNRIEGNSSNILFCIVIIFLILHLPRVLYFSLYMYMYILYDYGSSLELLNYLEWLSQITRLALLMNSSINFVIYSLVGSNFRTEVFEAFKCRKDPDLHTNTSDGGEVSSLEEYTRTIL